MPEQNVVRSLPCPGLTRSVDANGDWIIEGYASTDAVDNYNEIVDPEAFREHLPDFMNFPIMLLNHMWGRLPIGKFVSAEIRQRGLWVKGVVSKSAADVWTLIGEEILKAFSIGFRGLLLEESATAGKPAIWRKIRLFEISVVNVPANGEALFSVAKSRGLDLSKYAVDQPFTTKGGSGMPEITLDQMKQVAGEEVKALTPTIEAAAASAAESAVRKSTEPIQVSLGDAVRQLKEISDALKTRVTKAELDALKDAVTTDVAAIVHKAQRLGARGLGDLREDEVAQAPDFSVDTFEKSIAEELNTSQAHVRATIHKPEHLSKSPYVQQAVKDFHVANDNMHLLDVLAGTILGRNYRGPRTLKYWGVYSKLAAEYQKAMDTATATEGAEWIPTGFSAELQDRIELELVVGSKFRVFPMPTNPYKWPVKSTRGTAYLAGEPKDDTSAKITASTPKTTSATFTAWKLAMRVLASDEFVEDSVVPILPFLQTEIVETLARAIDDAILNGDTSATHQDSDVTSSEDHRKACSGLRFKALAAAGSKADIAGVTVADIRTIWALMGAFGGRPELLQAFMCLREYITMLGDSSIGGVSNVGQLAAILTGKVLDLYRIPVAVSEFSRKNLNASGVYDGVTTTKSSVQLVRTNAFLRGSRRRVRVESDRDIETQQIIVVGTTREDFQQMLAATSADFPNVVGYNAS